MSSFPMTFASCLTVLAGSLVGCTGGSATTAPKPVPPQAGHAHPSEGPHHGDLIELGNEEYHAELLHDKQTLTIYILNGEANEQVPIEASDITINAKLGGRPEQFKLAASPDQNDPPGKSSRFVSSDEDLADHVDEHSADAQLVLTINGKSYRGAIVHDHPGD